MMSYRVPLWAAWIGFSAANESCADTDENVLIQGLKPMQESIRSRQSPDASLLDVDGMPIPGTFEYIGCFVDDARRDLGAMRGNTRDHATNTFEGCRDECGESTYMSLQYGGECFCADAYGTDPVYIKVDDSNCAATNQRCSSRSYNCGGTWHQAIYQINGVQMRWALPSSWTIEASSSWNGNYGPNNVKERTGRPWHSRADFPQHLTFDAGEVVAVNAFATSQPPSGWAGSAMRGYTLLRSDNGEDWVEVSSGEGRNLPAGERQEIEFSTVRSRYWKLQIAGNHGYHRLVTTQYVEFRMARVMDMPGAAEYIGCFVDDARRDLGVMRGNRRNRATNTFERCRAECGESTYMSLQSGGECFCADAYGTDPVYRRVDDSNCAATNHQCLSNSFNCGGTWHQAIYQINDVQMDDVQMSWVLPSSWAIEASSSWDSNYGPNNVKERTGRPWHSRADFPQHLTFDAGEVVAVNAFATSQPPSGWAGSAMRGYTLLRSDNGEDWVQVTSGEGRNLPAGERQEIEFSTVRSRYWKLQISGNHGYYRLVTTQYVEFRIGEQAEEGFMLQYANPRLNGPGLCVEMSGCTSSTCQGHGASDMTLQQCSGNAGQIFIARSGQLLSALGNNRCLHVGHSNTHGACEPFTLQECSAGEARQQFTTSSIGGSTVWRNAATNLAIDSDSWRNTVDNWIWACPGTNTAKYFNAVAGNSINPPGFPVHFDPKH